MKIIFLLIVIVASVGLLLFVPNVHATESFHGTSSFENVPSEISRHFPSTFDIKLQYTAGPWGLDELVPVIEITPENAASHVKLDFESVTVQKGTIARIPVTITVDPAIEYEKIFLSVFFEGKALHDMSSKSGWNDSLVLSIGPRDGISRQVDYEIILWDDFQYDFGNDGQTFTKNMIPLSTLEAGKEHYVIQKVDFSDDNFAKNSTFSAVVGYAIQKGDKMIPFPKGENVTDAAHQEFSEKMRKLRNEFYQESEIAESFEFVVNSEKPFYVKSSLTIEESGKYTRQYYEKLKFSPAIMGSNMGGLVVLDKFSKAIDENGKCKNDEFRYLIKHDFSTAVCVEPSSALKLKERGWAL